MLTFSLQDQILTPILKRSCNLTCADCSTVSPTWASLDFGVFICSNCSGAHRSLGPTITRVKSTKLDAWHQDWVKNMQIGNEIINSFWEAKLTTKKVTSESSLDQVKRYVVDKYVRKKYACQGQDPLTSLKNGNTLVSLQAGKVQQKKPEIKQQKGQEEIRSANKNKTQKKNQQFDIFDFQEEAKCLSQKQQRPKVQDDDQFGDYTESTPTNQPQTTMSTTECLSFNDLLSQTQNRNPPQNVFVGGMYNMYQPNHMHHHINQMPQMPYLHKTQSQSHYNGMYHNMNMNMNINMNMPHYMGQNQHHQHFVSPQLRKQTSSNNNVMWHK